MATNQLTLPKHNPQLVQNTALRILLIGIGFLSVALGVIGIFLPLLPTTPFLLLSAACFTRTSPKFYDWLVAHPRLGKYIVYYLHGRGIPKKAKFYTLAMIWTTMLVSAFVLLDSPIVRVILPIIGVLVSIYILRQPNLELQPKSYQNNQE